MQTCGEFKKIGIIRHILFTTLQTKYRNKRQLGLQAEKYQMSQAHKFILISLFCREILTIIAIDPRVYVAALYYGKGLGNSLATGKI